MRENVPGDVSREGDIALSSVGTADESMGDFWGAGLAWGGKEPSSGSSPCMGSLLRLPRAFSEPWKLPEALIRGRPLGVGATYMRI